MMPLETAPQTLDDLNPLYPEATDVYTQGDDHIRSIKNVLATQFPGIAGQGFAIPITATEEEINFLSGVTSNIVDQYTAIELAFADVQDSVPAPYGTVCLFNQAAAPTGWEQITSYDDYMVRIVNTAGGDTGGTDSPFSFNWDHTHTTSSVTLSMFHLAPHRHLIHTCSDTNSVVGNTPDKRISVGNGAGPINSMHVMSVTGSSDPHTHGDTLGTTSDFSPLYLNTILARCTTNQPVLSDVILGLGPFVYCRLVELGDDVIDSVTGTAVGSWTNFGASSTRQSSSLYIGDDNAFSYSNSLGYIELDVTKANIPDSNWSLVALFNWQGTGSQVITIGNSGVGGYYDITVYINASGRVQVARANSGAIQYIGTSEIISPGTTYFLAIVDDGVHVTAYLDAELFGTTFTTPGVNPPTWAHIYNNPLVPSAFLVGTVGEVAIFHSILSPSDISLIYNSYTI